MNLESRPVVFEDIGRQVLATGERKEPEYFMSQIGKWLFRILLSIIKIFCTIPLKILW